MGEALDLAQQLVRLDTRAGSELAAAQLVADRLDDAGLDVRLDQPIPGRANIVARQANSPAARVTFTGHLDTVPADASSWSFDPLAGDVRDGRLRGRGSSDMKGGVAAQLVAAERAIHDGIVTPQLVFTFGEETGCDGALALDPGALLPSDLLIVAEPTSNRTFLGHKGTLWLTASAQGVSAHGSRPELGRNAIAALAAAAVRVHDYDDWPVSRTHGRSTVNVGTFHAGVQPNLVPDYAEMQLDVRTVPGFTADDAVRVLAQLCGDEVTLTRIMDLPGVDTDPDTPGVAAAREILAPGSSSEPDEYATYFTDASVLAGLLGDPRVVIFGPGDPDQAHVTDETCSAGLIEAATDSLHALLRMESESAS